MYVVGSALAGISMKASGLPSWPPTRLRRSTQRANELGPSELVANEVTLRYILTTDDQQRWTALA